MYKTSWSYKCETCGAPLVRKKKRCVDCEYERHLAQVRKDYHRKKDREGQKVKAAQ
jgi:uncharacterized Zn finger protein (UPF0148 family)